MIIGVSGWEVSPTSALKGELFHRKFQSWFHVRIERDSQQAHTARDVLCEQSNARGPFLPCCSKWSNFLLQSSVRIFPVLKPFKLFWSRTSTQKVFCSSLLQQRYTLRLLWPGYVLLKLWNLSSWSPEPWETNRSFHHSAAMRWLLQASHLSQELSDYLLWIVYFEHQLILDPCSRELNNLLFEAGLPLVETTSCFEL